MASRSKYQRASIKEDQIVRTICQRIFEGQLVSGEKLPTHVELQRHYRVAAGTVLRAMNRLTHDGFITANRKAGTRVAERPPHQHRFAYITHVNVQDKVIWRHLRFQRFLIEEAQALNQTGQAWLSTYASIDGRPDSEDYHRLRSDLANHRLAGLIFGSPNYLKHPVLVELLDEPGVPAVTLWKNLAHPHPNVSVVYMDWLKFLQQAAAEFQRQGRQRVALLTGGYNVGQLSDFHRIMAEHGLATDPRWIQGASQGGALFAAHCVRLLMDGPNHPDALLITEDSVVEHVMVGLRAAGVQVPEDLAVIAQVNYPRIPRTQVPVRWLGYDIHEILETCLNVLKQRRARRPVPRTIPLPPRWGDLGALRSQLNISKPAAAVS